MAATYPPSANEPVSPINTLAGYTLYKKNPINAPTKAAEIGSNPVPIETIVKNTAIIIVTLVASPSSPSVKFAPLTVPITAINKNITNNHVGIVISYPPVNGIIVDVPIYFIIYTQKTAVTTTCNENFCISVSPRFLFFTTFI